MEKVIIALFLFFINYVASDQSVAKPDKNTPSTRDSVALKKFCQQEAEKRYKSTLNDWKELNKRAEKSWGEYLTQEYLINHFLALQNKFGREALHFEKIVGTGLLVEINGNPNYEHTLFIRPELDAFHFPATDSTLEIIKHACGHSVGISVACNLAEILLKNRNFRWRKVVFLFSPSEEAPPSGLDSMLRQMDLQKYGKIMALGQHMSPSPEVKNNYVEVRAGVAQASSQVLRIAIDASLSQKNGHIADWSNINPLEIWDTLKMNITQQIHALAKGGNYLLRWSNIATSNPLDAPHNSLPQKAWIVGNFRTFDPLHEVEGLKAIDAAINALNFKYLNKAKISRTYQQAIPVLENDPALTEQVRHHGSFYLDKQIREHKLRLGADDFAFFKKYGIPAVLLRVGVEATGKLHTKDFEITDPSVLKTSLGLFTYLVYSMD